MSNLLGGRQQPRAVADHTADFSLDEDVSARHGMPSVRDGSHMNRSGRTAPGGVSGAPGGSGKRSTASSVSGASAGPIIKQPISDLDPHRLGQRQKQVDFGKNTIGYQRYLEQVPKDKRRRKGEIWLDPATPDILQNISKRAFDGQIKVWRRALHKYDDNAEQEEVAVRPMSYNERIAARNQDGDGDRTLGMDLSPADSVRSRGSLDGYLPPAGEAARKRGYTQAFYKANANPPSKLMTSPAGPRPSAPQSAPADGAASKAVVAGRCQDSPKDPALSRLSHGSRAAAAGGGGGAAAGVPKAPQTAPPAAAAAQGGGGAKTTATSTADGEGKAAGSADLFGEFDGDEAYAGLEPFDDYEDGLDDVGL